MKAMRQLKIKEKYITDGEERDLARHPAAGGGGDGWGTNATFLVQSVTPKTLGSTMDDQQTY